MADLSILIPSNNEEYLAKTVEDICAHIEGDTEILIGLDGGDIPKISAPNIKVIVPSKPMGQRALTNHLAKMSEAKYLMKVDAHCSFSQGFDNALVAEMDDTTILSPLLLVLEGRTWSINGKKQMLQFEFGRDFVMKHKEGDGGETMCLQGSAWLIDRENYWKWNVCDETLGSWGGQAVELGIAAWRNGGRCRTTRAAYYGHVFRLQNEEFPYDRGQSPGKFATEELKRRHENQIQGLVEKFGRPLDWKNVV